MITGLEVPEESRNENAIMKAIEFIHEVINDQRCEVDD